MSEFLQTSAATPRKKFHHSMAAADAFNKSLAAEAASPVVQNEPSYAVPSQEDRGVIHRVPSQEERGVIHEAPKENTQYVPDSQNAHQDYTGFSGGGLSFDPVTSSQVQQPVSYPPVITPEEKIKFELEKQTYLQQIEELKSKLEEAQQIPDELLRLQEEKEIREHIERYGTELSSIDPEDAKKLLGPVLAETRSKLNSLRKEALEAQKQTQKLIDDRISAIEQREAEALARKVEGEVRRAIPDFDRLIKSEAYNTFMMAPVMGDENLRVYHLANQAARRGDSEWIINQLKSIQSSVPSIEAISSVSTTGSASAVPSSGADGTGDILSEADIEELNFLVSTKQISREEFREKIQKNREARKAQSA